MFSISEGAEYFMFDPAADQPQLVLDLHLAFLPRFNFLCYLAIYLFFQLCEHVENGLVALFASLPLLHDHLFHLDDLLSDGMCEVGCGLFLAYLLLFQHGYHLLHFLVHLGQTE